ncbi:restriction endonuclease subunit S [Paenibacillus sp. FSL H7-0350]|uniref:restriction endonuclease subunit S n=1 Tax=Paenibacillus sp. FSL H7-0350 TaxID=2975345 RepID=UPI00315916C6
MSKNKGKAAEELLQEALVPVEEQPYKVPENWSVVKLQSVCAYIQRGKSPKYTDDVHEFPVISQKCVQWSGLDISKARFIEPNTINSYQPERFLQDYDILWNSTGEGTIGRVALYRTKATSHEIVVADSHVTIVRSDKRVLDPRFLFYWLSSPYIQKYSIGRSISGTTKQTELSTSAIKEMLCFLPPLFEQKRIADKVERLLRKINQAKQLIEEAKETFELRRAAILDKVFRGELTANWREKNPDIESIEDYLAKIRIKQEQDYQKQCELAKKQDIKKPTKLVRKTLKDKIPEYPIPDNWRWIELGDIITDLTDYHANGSYEILKKHVTLLDTENYAFMIRATNFEKDNFSTLMKYLSKSAYDFLSKSKLYGGEILISKIGNTGSVYLMPELDRPSSLGMNLFALRIDENIDNEYVFYFLKSPLGKTLINQYIRGVTTTSIDKISVRSVWIPLPGLKEQMKIKTLINQLLGNEDKSLAVMGSGEYLNTLEQSVLSKAFLGELGTNDINDDALEIIREVFSKTIEDNGF